MRRIARAVAPLALLLIASPSPGQEALVLSGGSARGIAHAGALVGLERRGHHPEIVVGTSMGAVIGGLYATGRDADAVERIVREQRWRELFMPLPVIVGSEREVRHPVFRLHGGPTGLAARSIVADWRVNRELVRQLFDSAARARGDFDRLPRRFRAVAVDLQTGELVVLERGDLARAVRASLASPAIFAPVSWEGRALVDGVLRDYLPVALARAMGGSTVVACDVIRPGNEALSSDAGAVADRGINWLTVHARADTTPPDATIRPVIERAPSPIVYPTDPSPLVQAGLEGALAAELPEPIPPRGRVADAPPAALTSLVVADTDPILAGFVAGAFRRSAPAPYDEERILATVDRLYATGLFEGVWPWIEDSAAAGSGAALRVHADARGPMALLGSLGYDNDRGGRAWLTLRRLVHAGAPVDLALEGMADGIEKTVAACASAHGSGFGSPAWAAGAGFSEKTLRFPEADGLHREVERAEAWLALDLRRIDPAQRASLSLVAERVRAEAGPEGDQIGPTLRLGQISGFEPPIGAPNELVLEARFGELDYQRGRLRLSTLVTARRTSFSPTGWLEWASLDAPWDRRPALGDEHWIPGLSWGAHRARVVFGAGLDVAQVIPLKTTVVLRSRVGGSDERVGPGVTDDDWVGGASLSLYWWLPLGRAELGAGAATTGDRRIDVRLGADF